MNDWDGDERRRQERRRSVELLDTRTALTDEELRELKALASYSKAARWLVAGVLAATGFLGLDRVFAWLKH